MALALRSQSAPQCLACLRRLAIPSYMNDAAPSKQHVRGKKKMVNNSDFLTVRLRKDVETFGRKGALVPIARGQMRNRWFPFGIAEYVTAPELKTLRLRNVPMERDFQFGAEKLAKGKKGTTPEPEVDVMDVEEIVNASAFQKKVEVEKLSPERSVELIERFVRPQLEFYRQPILEEVKEVEPEEPPPEPRKMANYGTGAAADLLAARAAGPVVPQKVEKTGPQAIYGSVSPLDVLQAVRAALQEDDEAKRVVLSEQDVQFIDLPETEKVVKHVGTFVVEIQVKGAEEAVSRIVRVIPQEL